MTNKDATKHIDDAQVGDMVDETTIPKEIVDAGGGWVGNRYVCTGCHKDGTIGFKLKEIRTGGWF